MTHDFHFYITFMCARNAGFNFEDSRMIALFADAVDGGTPEAAKKYPGQVSYGNEEYTPISVYGTKHYVNTVHSIGSSLVSIPWMAFHFLPNLNNNDSVYEKDDNRYKREFNLKCSHDSNFAKELIKYTIKEGKKRKRRVLSNTTESNTTENKEMSLAFLGVRAHVIADLFAHEQFVGFRSMNVNALTSVKILKNEEHLEYFKLNYSPNEGSVLKNTGVSRLGHAQAGRLPDEPFVVFSCTRKTGLVSKEKKFKKNNYNLFGQALVVLTEVLRGSSFNKLVSSLLTGLTKWDKFEDDKCYRYKWKDIRVIMNNDRKKRLDLLRLMIFSKEGKNIDKHNGEDSWALDKLKEKKAIKAFYKQVDTHLEWFHQSFNVLTGESIKEYMENFLKDGNEDDKHAIKINNKLTKDVFKKIAIKGKNNISRFKLKGAQVGLHYMLQEQENVSLSSKTKCLKKSVKKGINKVKRRTI